MTTRVKEDENRWDEAGQRVWLSDDRLTEVKEAGDSTSRALESYVEVLSSASALEEILE